MGPGFGFSPVRVPQVTLFYLSLGLVLSCFWLPQVRFVNLGLGFTVFLGSAAQVTLFYLGLGLVLSCF